MVYGPDIAEVHFAGEWTSTRKDGTFGFQAIPRTKCSSVSLALALSKCTSESDASDDVLETLPCPAPSTSGASSSSVDPRRTHSSAPLVTKLENLFNLRPPSRLLRKLGNHSPVLCGTSAGSAGDVDRVGVIEPDSDVSRLGFGCAWGTSSSSPSAGMKSVVNYEQEKVGNECIHSRTDSI